MLLCICKKEDSIRRLIYFWRTDCYAKAELPTGSADRFMHHISTQLKGFLYTSTAIPHQKHTEGSDALLLRWSSDNILLEETQRGTLCKNYLTLYHTPELWFFFPNSNFMGNVALTASLLQRNYRTLPNAREPFNIQFCFWEKRNPKT